MSVHVLKRSGRPLKNEGRHTRELILDAAEAIIVSHGTEGVKLQTLAERVDIRVPSIYAHFKNGREGVLYAVGERYISSLARQFQYTEGEDPEQALMRETRRLVLHLATNPAYVKLSLVDLGHPGGVDILNVPAGGDSLEILSRGPLSVMYNRLNQMLSAGKEQGVFRRNIDVISFLRAVMGTTLVSLTWPSHSSLGGNHDNITEVEQVMAQIEDLAQKLILCAE